MVTYMYELHRDQENVETKGLGGLLESEVERLAHQLKQPMMCTCATANPAIDKYYLSRSWHRARNSPCDATYVFLLKNAPADMVSTDRHQRRATRRSDDMLAAARDVSAGDALEVSFTARESYSGLVQSAWEQDEAVYVGMVYDNGDVDARQVLLASSTASAARSHEHSAVTLKAMRFSKYTGKAASSTVLRLGKQYIHRPLKTTVELHSDTIGAGAFNICCAPKVLKYSATGDPRSELKHAKSLNFGGAVVFVVAVMPKPSPSSSSSSSQWSEWNSCLRTWPSMFDIFGEVSASGVAKEIFV